MYKYKVTTPRFHEGVLYGPGTRRNFISYDKPFPKGKMPDGLEPVIKADEKKAVDQTLDTPLIRKVMLEMIEKKEGCSPEGVPNMAPLKLKCKLKFGQEVRDEIMADIEQEKQHKIEIDDVTFTGDAKPSSVQTL